MVFSTHRGVVAGRRVNNNEILDILRESDDGEKRREAWEASKTVGAAVADDVRELARLRNAAAHAVGYRDWFALSLALSEMDEAKLFATLDEVDAATAEPFARWKLELDEALAARFGCSATELAPWHYADPFFQEVPVEGGVDLGPILADGDTVALSERTFTGIGLETRPVLDRSDLFPRDDKCQHAFCIDIDREGDVRVLANVVPGQYWLDTMLHELGHATFDGGIDPTLPWMLRDCHTRRHRGDRDPDGATRRRCRVARARPRNGRRRCCRNRCGSPRSACGGDARLCAVGSRDDELRALALRGPGVRISTLGGGNSSSATSCSPLRSGRSNADWAAKIHVACAPVYYHCYLFGHLVASQLSATLERECGGLVDRPAAGALLRERIFHPGQSVRWDRLLEQATGEPLTATYFGRDIGAA